MFPMIRPVRSALYIALCFVALIEATAAQADAAREKLIAEVTHWERSVNTLIEEIPREVSALGLSEQGFYVALLARITREQNPEGAGKLLRKAIDLSISDLKSTHGDTTRKLEIARKTLEVAASIDKQLADGFSRQVSDAIADRSNTGTTKAVPDWIVATALTIADSNPTLAYQMGVQSLRSGLSLTLPRLITRLALKDRSLGERLLLATLPITRRTADVLFMEALSVHLFQLSSGAAFSESARRLFLEVLADTLMLGLSSVADSSRCGVAKVIAPILARFDELLPAFAPVVRQNISACLTRGNLLGQAIRADTERDEMKSADDFFGAARNTDDRGLKARFFSAGISIMSREGRFVEIVRVLDDMTEDERKAVGPSWDYWRVEYAAKAAREAVKADDVPAAFRIVGRTPKFLRPQVRLKVIKEIPKGQFREFVLENLYEIRKEVNSLDILPRDAAEISFSILPCYLDVQPYESTSVFDELVKHLNKADSANSESLPEKDFLTLADYIPVPIRLMELDEYGVSYSISQISSRRTRARVKLGLLESSIKKLVELKKRIPLEKQRSVPSVVL